MCLGVPGRIVEVEEGPLRLGRVAFGEVVKQVSLALVPEALLGEFVMVHAGTALEVIDEAAAERVFRVLEDLRLESAEGQP
ncbi:MAG TPA: HypC/HybG/HupF family hydrogenase formation chaperone [Holophagaceae bacterium]|nr:HypC/HybG/HupF family hydrogenase formation chaperone [Holophagaceae bacterium]